MKQFLFDELANLYLKSIHHNRQTLDCWDRLTKLLPFVIECIGDDNLILENYQLPYHPSIVAIDDQRQPLLNLFFFYLQRLMNDETIKLMQSTLTNIRNIRSIAAATKIFEKLKDYFLIRLIALLLCEANISPDDQRMISRITLTIINMYLSIDREAVQLNPHLQIFLSTIISKRS